MLIRILSLLIIAFSVNADLPPRTVQWPLGEDVSPWRGYGQSNSWMGFHWALDFHGTALNSEDIVSTPYPYDGGWCLAVSYGADTIIDSELEGLVLIGTNRHAVFGWDYEHIDIDHEDYPFICNPITLLGRDQLAPLATLSGNLGDHVHFAWLSKDDFEPPIVERTGYVNPIVYLYSELYPYNVAKCGVIDYEEIYSSGVIFANDEIPFPIPEDQSYVRDRCDILIRPYTFYFNDPTNQYCIVSKVSWRLLKQSPQGGYSPMTLNLLGA
jgi:hypothetical protein